MFWTVEGIPARESLENVFLVGHRLGEDDEVDVGVGKVTTRHGSP